MQIYKKINLPTVLTLLFAIVLTSIWFDQKYILATAEEGMPFYDSLRTFTLYKSLWLDIGFGFADPFFTPRLILYGFAAVLQNIGLSNWFIQAIVFFILLITPLLAVPKLMQTLFPEKEKLYGYVAALFYLFNLYTLTQIFERFIYPLMFLWSYLPLFLLFWITWMEKKKIKYLCFLIISSFLYADVFGLTSSFIILSTVAVSYVFYKIIFEKEKVKTFVYGLGGFFVWGLFQLWWLLPIWSLRNGVYTGFFSGSNALASLKEVSQYFPTTQIIFLKQGYFFW